MVTQLWVWILYAFCQCKQEYISPKSLFWASETKGRHTTFPSIEKASAISVGQKSVALIATLIARAVDKFCTGARYCVPPVTPPCSREHPIQLYPRTLSRDSTYSNNHSKRSKEATMPFLTLRGADTSVVASSWREIIFKMLSHLLCPTH